MIIVNGQTANISVKGKQALSVTGAVYTLEVTGAKGNQGIEGMKGLSAYEVAVENGFEGTEAEWLESLQGGPQGPEGPAGPAGADGKTVRSGSGVPSSGLGVDGDFYINTSANTIYGPKTSGSWGSPTSLVGPQGATGATGPTGPAGNPVIVVANRQTATYNLLLSDAGKMIEMNVGTANDLNVPLNSSQAFDIGTQILVVQYGAGQTTIKGVAGVTVNSAENKNKIAFRYAAASLVKVGTNEWHLFGNLV